MKKKKIYTIVLLFIALFSILISSFSSQRQQRISQREKQQEALQKREELKTLIMEQMIYLPSGVLKMGSQWTENQEMNDEGPIHPVSISSFYISKYEWTHYFIYRLIQLYPQELYIDQGKLYHRISKEVLINLQGRLSPWVVNENNNIEDLQLAQEDFQLPVYNITWKGAIFFCNLLNELFEYPPSYNLQNGFLISDEGFRLPSEAQWEWAALAGGNSADPYAGGDSLDQLAWYWSNGEFKAHTVGGKTPNSIGLYDMTGNLYEWCSDWYDFSYYSVSPEIDPLGPVTGQEKVIRGGSFSDQGLALNIRFRFFRSPRAEHSFLGFRPILFTPESP
ncbi:MAG: SUMF1/EgtB/PvdO family nonheme iron enzyme [Spirochaetaceae bacterium]|nr:SUMF1/EgtB/PvdO family nonheme iron enzyme [Spirochaetaceae bacterium]